MRIYTNEKHIEKRAKWGQRISMIGLLILLLGMAASFSPGVIQKWLSQGNPAADTAIAQWLLQGGWIYVSMAALLIGFMLGQIGNANVRKYKAYPRADHVITKALKGFDDRNHFYAWTSPTDLVLAGPSGIYAFVTRSIGGKVTVQEGKIKQPFSLRRLVFLFGQEPGGAPGAEAEAEAEKLSAWLTEQIGEGEPVEVKPLVVFTNEKAAITVQSSDVPMVHFKQLKQYLRGELRGKRLRKAMLGAVIETLNAEAARQGVEPEA